MMTPQPPGQPNPSSRTTPRVPPSSADAGPIAADRVTELAHELTSLLDGSMRWLSLASRGLPESGVQPGAPLSETRQHIDHARTALVTMSNLVGAAMRPVPIGSPLHRPEVGINLGQAIDHSVEVARPRAADTDIEIDVSIATLAGQASSGPLYSVILNGILNAVESIERCRVPGVGTGPVCGKIEIEAGVVEEGSGRSLMIEIRDDGQGLPERANSGNWPFEHGHSMKPGGTGLGLAIAKRTIEEVGGKITLTQRSELRLNPDRPGARLVIRLPLQGPGDTPIGGESAD